MMPARAVVEARDAVEAALLPAAKARLQELGPAASGIGHCAAQVGDGWLFEPYELALVDRLLNWPGTPNVVHEIGGSGLLSPLLAYLGFDAVRFEPDAGRKRGLVALSQALASAHPRAGARWRVLDSRFPPPGNGPAREGALAIVTHLDGTATPADRGDFVRSIAAYDLAAVDVDRFFEPCRVPADRRRVLGEFRAAGRSSEVLLDLGAPGHFCLFYPTELPLAPPFKNNGGVCWHLRLPEWTKPFGDGPDDARRSSFELRRDGEPIGFRHQLHSEIAAGGAGRYSHWGRTLYFSAPDNSDPNVGQHRYSLRPRELVTHGTPQVLARPVTAAKSGADPHEQLADILRRRGVRSIAYFHTDHFEPWAGRTADEQWRGLERFRQLTAGSRFGSRQSLFYTPLIAYKLRSATERPGEHVEGDEVLFLERSADFVERCRQFVGSLAGEGGHEFHLHVHHEWWTRNDGDLASDVSRWVNEHSTAALDAARLSLYIEMSLRAIRQETGKPLQKWAFVHGNWALNASDRNICKIEDEIAILMRHGCFGDFTFPAGRGHCNPTALSVPYTCLPVHGPKSYDTPPAEARPVGPKAGAFSPARFLIWNSAIKADRSSLDFFYEPNARLFKEPHELLSSWLGDSNVIGGRLFIKTHAHSLDPSYKPWNEDAPIPHSHPDIVRVFETLARVCDLAKIDCAPVTVNEVADTLFRLDQGLPASNARPPPEAIVVKAQQAGVSVRTSADASRNGAAQNEVGSPPPDCPPGTGEGPQNRNPDNGWAAAFLQAQLPDMAAAEFAACKSRLVTVAERVAAAAAQIEKVLLPVARDRMARMGELRSGAYTYYATRLARGELIAGYEKAVAGRLVDWRVAPKRIHEVGGGYGTLSLLLAFLGFETVCIEADPARCAGGQALLDALVAAFPEVGGRCRFVPNPFPVGDEEAEGALVLASNIICTAAAEVRARLVKGFAAYDVAVIDVDRFVAMATGPEDRETVIRDFAAQGSVAEPFLDLGQAARFYLLRKSKKSQVAASAKIGAETLAEQQPLA